MPNFVITKTPLRVSFLGGGTDIDYFYKKYGGAVLSTAIDKYVYITVKRYSKLYKKRFRLNYSVTQNTNYINKIRNNIIRECLKVVQIRFPIYVSIVSDIPSGSGLGGSSSVVVGLLKALYELIGKKISKKKIYELACYIEISILKQPMGKQDQFPAVYGGINFVEFQKDGKVKFKAISLNVFNPKLFSNSLLVWTQNTRSATKELQIQKKNFRKNEKYLLKIKKNLYDLKSINQFQKVNLKEFGSYINFSWQHKLKLIRMGKRRYLENFLYSNKNNFYGSKLLGAGAGGFWYILAKKANLDLMQKKNKSLIFLKINISKKGTEVICSS
jgi:D-glycero-alpha-D-manno-heptose-7-phosphate kinase